MNNLGMCIRNWRGATGKGVHCTCAKFGQDSAAGRNCKHSPTDYPPFPLHQPSPSQVLTTVEVAAGEVVRRGDGRTRAAANNGGEAFIKGGCQQSLFAVAAVTRDGHLSGRDQARYSQQVVQRARRHIPVERRGECGGCKGREGDGMSKKTEKVCEICVRVCE